MLTLYGNTYAGFRFLNDGKSPVPRPPFQPRPESSDPHSSFDRDWMKEGKETGVEEEGGRGTLKKVSDREKKKKKGCKKVKKRRGGDEGKGGFRVEDRGRDSTTKVENKVCAILGITILKKTWFDILLLAIFVPAAWLCCRVGRRVKGVEGLFLYGCKMGRGG